MNANPPIFIREFWRDAATGRFIHVDPLADLDDLAAPLTANLTPRTVRERSALVLRARYGDLDACEREDLR